MPARRRQVALLGEQDPEAEHRHRCLIGAAGEAQPPVHGDGDVLSPRARAHLNVLGRYTFTVPEQGRQLRPLRHPDTADDDPDGTAAVP